MRISSLGGALRLAALPVVLAVALLAPVAAQPLTASPAAPTESAPACAGLLCAGAGRAEMTPPVGTPMAGFNSRSAAGPSALERPGHGVDPNLYATTFLPSVGVHTRLHARALVLQDPSGRRAALVTAENRGVPYEAHQAVLDRLQAAGAGIDRAALLISSTHSHAAAGPINPWAGYQIVSTDVFDPRIFELTVAAITDAVLAAVADLGPARAAWGEALVSDATRNRSLEAHRANFPEDDQPDLADTIDPRLPVLRVERPDGTPIGAYSVFAVHGTSFGGGNPYLSGDNMATSQRLVEAELGVPHVQANGAEGDISPSADDEDLWVGSQAARAELVGRRIAEGVIAAWGSARPGGPLDLDARLEILWFRGQEGTSPVPLVGCPGNVCPDGMTSPVDLPGQGSKLPLAGGFGGYPPSVPLQVLRVGRTVLVGVPFEPTKEAGARIEAAVLEAAEGAVDRAIIVGMANSYASYLATPEEYDAARYEGAWTLWGPGQLPLVQSRLAELTRRMANGEPAPDFDEPPLLGPHLGVSETRPPADTSGSAGTLLASPEGDVERLREVTVSWHGGDPAVDHARDGVLVSLVDAAGTVIATDDGDALLTYTRERAGGPNRWSLRDELPIDLPAGAYRYVVTGHWWDGQDVRPYEIETPAFTVVPSTALAASLVLEHHDDERSVARVVGGYPDPGAEALRLRPRWVDGGEAALLVDGEAVPLTYDAEEGAFTALVPSDAAVTLPAGWLRDRAGNTTSTDVAP